MAPAEQRLERAVGPCGEVFQAEGTASAEALRWKTAGHVEEGKEPSVAGAE